MSLASARYMHLCFDAKTPPDHFDANQDVMDRERMEAAALILKFELVRSSVTEKYLGIVHQFLVANKANGCPDRIGYNYYIKRNPKYILQAKRNLNKTIERINAKNRLQIHSRLTVDSTVFESEHKNVNELHYIFESEKRKNMWAQTKLMHCSGVLTTSCMYLRELSAWIRRNFIRHGT